MKLALLNLLRVLMLFRHSLPVFLFILASFNSMADCPATVTATPAATNICAGDSVLMRCTDPAATTWQWYKDGVILTDSVNSTCYAKEAGNYTVTTDVCNIPSAPVIVTIKPIPSISISTSSILLCSGQQVTLTVNPGPNVVWAWIAPLPNAWTNTNPLTVSLTTPTTFQLVGANQITECANTTAVTVNVLPPLTPGTIHSNAQVCPGGIPPLITSDPATGGSGMYTYQWQMSTSSASAGFTDIPGATSPTYQPGATNVTTWYRLVVFSLPCDPENSNAVVVQVDEIPVVTSATIKTICTGDNVSYIPTSNVANATYTWTASVTSGSVTGFTPSGSGNINDILSLFPLGSATPAEVTYTISPTGPATSFCPGTTTLDLVVTVYPVALVTNPVLAQDICAGTITVPVILQSNIAGATFSWTASGTAGLSGYQASGTGNIPAMTISSLLSVAGEIKYTITPQVAGSTCPTGPSVEYTINVNPSPSVTNNPMQQTICSGDKTSLVTLTSNVPATTFNWTADASAGISGFQASGTNTIPVQDISNISNVQSMVTYHIVPNASANGCQGIAKDYVVNVNPVPVVTAPQLVYTLCSGNTTNIPLSSTVAGTTFSWTASSPSAITGFSDGTGSVIIQKLDNTSNANHTVTYVITPTSNGCVGSPITVKVTITPEQLLTVIPASPTTCSGTNVLITLAGNVPGIDFTWTAATTGNVTGFSDGSGSTISPTLINHDNVIRTVDYSVTMSLNGCFSGVKIFTVTVYPTPAITNNPLNASMCSGSAFNLALSSNVAGSTYSWTANGTPGISGYSSGSAGTINQQVSNSTNAPGTVIYTITPSANGCQGTPSDFRLTVNPIPVVNLSQANQSICSGTSTSQVDFFSSIPGTTYSWTATPSGAGISGYTASGSTASIPSQIISSTLSTQGLVTYAVTPSFAGCTGNIASHIVTINPLPLVTNTLTQIICNGGISAPVNLLSNVAGTSFSWTAAASSGAITGFLASGGNTIPQQTIYNSSLLPGSVTYTITPTSTFGPNCAGTDANYSITVNPSPTITSSLNEAVCSGQPFSYSITADLPGSFTWSRAAVAGINNPSTSGTSANFTETLINATNSDIDVQYMLTPTGQAPSLCAGTPVILTVKVRALPVVNSGADFTIPYGTFTSLSGTASGGTGSLDYSWSPNTYIGSGINTLTPQSTNLTVTRTYSLTANDAKGCSASDQIMVIVVGTPLTVAPISSPTEICVGESATINANATGGSGTYTYSWTSLPSGFTSTASSITVTPSVNTQYIVTINDGFNSASATVTTTVNPLPLKFGLTGGGTYCIGGSGVVVGLAGSQTGVNYQLYNNGTSVGSPVPGNDASISFGNQTLAGVYTATATRASTLCSQSMGSSVSVSINSLPVANAGADQSIPYGTNALLSGSVSGGFGTMNYSWEPTIYIASGGNTSSPLTTNLYSNTTFTLKITDANGCVGTDDMTVSLNGNAVNVTTNSNPAQICADASQAQLTAVVTGGTGSYTYSWTSIPTGSPAWTSTEQNPWVSPDVNTIYTVTANDGFNSAIASATVIVNPLPNQYSVTGSGSYCYAGSGVNIGLSGSQPNTNYQLFRGGIADGPAVTGDGNPISFGNRTAAFTYTVSATNNITGCTNQMTGSATVIILPPPSEYLVSGGGSYPVGGPGRVVGLMHGDAGVSYQLYCDNVPVGSPITGNELPIDFGFQTQAGTYTVVATDLTTGCTANSLGSVDITVLPAPLLFHVTGGGTICSGEPGLPVGLSGSEAGLNYQLIYNGFPQGSPVAGTNFPLAWGPKFMAGLYEVRAVNSLTGTSKMMLDSAVIVINPSLTIYNVDPIGSQCPGTIIRLNGSEAGVTYYLLVNGIPVDTLAGTGVTGFLDFGPQTANGTYTISAVNTLTGCHAMMNGSTYINVAPQVFTVIPAGILCPGQEIRLTGSEAGVNYQLRWNGTFDLGSPVAGTGSDLLIGNAGLPGIYSVVAIDAATSCVSYMNDSATLYPDPTAFTIVPDGAACEGESIGQNGSEIGVDYVLLLDNTIHLDTIPGTGMPINFGPQLTGGNYTILAIHQFSYCQFNMNGTTVMNDSPVKYSLLPAGIQCIGNNVSLSGSQPGVTYQLMLNGIYNIGLPVAGTGNAIDFGTQSLTGTYTVRAVNDVTGCNSIMADSTVFEPLPVVFTTIPAGNSHCAGTIVGLDGSEINFNYILVLDGAINLDTIAGTGNAIDFGVQVTAGTYSVVAYNTASYCSSPMNGISVIEASPLAFNMTPAGNACIGNGLGLENSETGIIYQLRWNGSINVGSPVAGTGSAISFGAHNLTGTYSVIATNLNGCTSAMSSIVIINPLPVAFNVIPSGLQCQGTVLGLDGSEVNVNYILVLNGNVLADTIAGTGSTISFGPQLTSGNYSVIAYFKATSCQSVMNGSSVISDVAPTIYTMTPAGIICAGANIGVDNSEIGAFYQLRLNGTINMGSPVAGTGSAISFGVQTVSGIYTAIATNSDGCNSLMTGNVEMNSNPVAYEITPTGTGCPGTVIGTNGSESGVNYILILDGSINIDTIAGNGSPLSFGVQTTSGIYTVIAIHAATLCQKSMNGNTVILPAPIAYSLTPAGISCTGITIGIEDSETGVLYQLRRNGTINIGTPVAGTGFAVDFGVQTMPGTYTVEAAGINGCTAMMNTSVVVNPGPLVFTQFPAGSQCPGTAITLNGSETGINYVLLRDGIFHIDTLSGTGSSLNFGTQMIAGTYMVAAFSSAAACPAVMNGITTIVISPTAFNVTPAGLFCASANIGLDGSEAGVDYTLFKNGVSTGITLAGTGNTLSFGTSFHGFYTIKAVTLTTGCSRNMTGTIQISNPATVNSGSDQTICASGQVNVNAIVINGGTITWTTSGDGIFNNTSALNTLYTPGSSDLTSGTVYLLLTANGTGSCITNMVTDTLEVKIDQPATANAGGDLDVCTTGGYTITNASATNFNAVNWSASGTGNLVNGNTLTPAYTPSAADISSGSVALTMQVTGNSPCSNTATDSMVLTFHPAISVNAGPDTTINYGDTFIASAASVLNSASVQWSTSGSGTFNNSSFVNATYTPSNADFAQGSVILTLTTINNAPCAPVADLLTLTLTNNWKTEFTWGSSCEAQPVAFSVNSTVTNVNAVASWLWNFGDGNTSSQMNPAHLFAGTGGYNVTLTATDTLGNVRLITHHVIVSPFPVSYFKSSLPNCSNEPVHFTDLAHTLYGHITEWIWNYGDGSANDTIQFPDEPNTDHHYNAAGTFNAMLTVTNSFGCAHAVTLPVEVIEAPIANFQYNDDCSGLETSFRDASYANGPGNTVQYWWDFGDPSTGTDNYAAMEDATHIFSAPGTYQVTHVVRNFNNCTDTIVKPVVILTPVPVDFVYGYTCVNGITDFGPDTSAMNIADITSWTWDFGDGVTNQQQYTNHSYAAPGSYQVTLTVISISGCTAFKTKTLVVNPLPVAMFSVKQFPCENASVHFDDASATYAGFVKEWNWDFGDGNTHQVLYPSNPDIDHTYTAPGTYTVKLTIVSSDRCTAERSETIVVIPAPTANFGVSNTCQGSPVQFADLTQTSGAGIITGWKWNFGDGATGINNISSLQNPVHNYSTTGAYQVSLAVTAANGCSSIFEKTVVITDAPFVDFSYDNHCASTIIQFTKAAGIDFANVAAWSWSFGDGLISAIPDPQHIYSTPGNYNVTLTITNIAGCENTISHTITILPAPVASFITGTPVCSQNQVTFTDKSSASIGYIMRWEYNFGDGTGTIINYPENPVVSHIYDTYGIYNATLTVVTNDNCSATVSKSINILPGPLANFDYDASCLDIPVQFNDLSQGNVISWAWNFDDPGSLASNTSTLKNPSHLFRHAGNFLVTLLVQSANGCHDTVTRTISIAPKPAVDFSFSAGCSSDTVQFMSSGFVDAASTSSWEWQFGDNTTSVAADPYHIYTNPGTYSVSLTITNQNGCTNVKTRQVQVTTAPIAMFTSTSLSCSGTAVLFTDLSSTPNGLINSWKWNFDDGNEVTVNAPSDGNVSHTFSAAGIYHVTLTIRTSTGCEASYAAAIAVKPAPATAFSYANNCGDISTSFTDQSQPSGGNTIISWSWNFGDPYSGADNISDMQNPKHRFTGTGTYTIILTTENTLGCTTSIVKQILAVTGVPTVDFNVPSACLYTPVLFSVDSTATNVAEIKSYTWDFGDGTPTSEEAEPGHIYSQAGEYEATLTITTTGGCKNSVSHYVTVNPAPVPQFTYSGNCASSPVTFTDISYNPAGEKITAWSWDFGVSMTSDDISSQQNPSYNYNVSGTYNVSLTISSESGCTVTKVMPVTVIAAAEAKFSFKAQPCNNGLVIFQNESISTQSVITGWNWEFAPGVYSSMENPTYTFGNSDTCYNVKLTVTTSNGCSNTLIREVCIPSGIEVAVNYTQACFGETTWFSSTIAGTSGGSIAAYSWNFGDPATAYNNESKLANPQHTFSKPGTYIVLLKATDMNKCSVSKYISITVDALPKADFSYEGGACDSLVRFTDITSGAKIVRWIWQFGDGKSKIIDAPASPDANNYYTYPGVYEVTLITRSEAGCSDTIRKTIRRTPCIAAAFKVSDPVVCVKRSMKFTESSTCQAPIASWTWYFGDNTSATYTSPQQTVEHTYSTPGNYKVTMVVATQMVGGMATDTASNHVSVKPAAKASYAWQDVCVGNSTSFDNQSLNNNTTIKSYLWNFGDPGSLSDTTSAKNAQYRYDVFGEYEVKLVVTNTLGCTDTVINKINIFESPEADFSWKNSCEAKPVYFTDKSQATSSDIVKWNWKFSNAGEVLEGSNQRNCIFSFAKAGVYDADMNVTDKNGCSATVNKQVTVHSNPVAAFSIVENYEDKQGQIMISNGTINGTSHEWEISNGKTSFATNPVITFDKEGHYTIQLTTRNDENCVDTMSMSYNLMYKGLYVPNAFNPGNFDDEVAVFRPKGTNLKFYNIGIYDRWGNLLWSSNKIDERGSPAESWDGKLHGELLKQDVYVWKITAQYNDGEVWDGQNAGNNENMPQQKAGTVTLIR